MAAPTDTLLARGQDTSPRNAAVKVAPAQEPIAAAPLRRTISDQFQPASRHPAPLPPARRQTAPAFHLGLEPIPAVGSEPDLQDELIPEPFSSDDACPWQRDAPCESDHLTNRQESIRLLDLEDDLFDPEYLDEVVSHMLQLEKFTRPSLDLIDSQPDISWYMRPYLIDFLLEMHATFEMSTTTLFVGVGLLDRYLSKRVVLKKHLQLAGATALWIAAKYEDAKDCVPTAAELVVMCGNTLDQAAFHQMEAHIVSTLKYRLGRPSQDTWLRLYLSQEGLVSGDHHETDSISVGQVARMAMDISLYHRDIIPLAPSSVARGALWLAQRVLSPMGPHDMMYASETDLDEASYAVANTVHTALARNDVSQLISLKHPQAYHAVRGILKARYSQYTARAHERSLSSQANGLATPPLPPLALDHCRSAVPSPDTLPPTPSLWLTPQMFSNGAGPGPGAGANANSVNHEDDLGPYTPSTVFSPLATGTGGSRHGAAAGHRGQDGQMVRQTTLTGNKDCTWLYQRVEEDPSMEADGLWDVPSLHWVA